MLLIFKNHWSHLCLQSFLPFLQHLYLIGQTSSEIMATSGAENAQNVKKNSSS